MINWLKYFKKKIFFGTVAVISMSILNASSVHSTKEAFFEVIKDSSKIKVIAEFPWTLRISVLAYFPELQKQTTQEYFDKKIIEYFQKNITIQGDKKKFKLEKVSLKNGSHSHSLKYELIFNGKALKSFSIMCTCMFNINKDQKNYFLYRNKLRENQSYVLTTKNPSFAVNV